SASNRTPLVRVPTSRGMSTRVELRSVDPSANPYLALAVLLKAGLSGIQENKVVADPIGKNSYQMSSTELGEQDIERLPATLYEAVSQLKKDSLMREAMGEHMYNNFITIRTQEWIEYNEQVSPWEQKKYFKR